MLSFFILASLTIIACSNQAGSLLEKEQAERFSLSFVETYFTKDCDKFYNSWADYYYIIDDKVAGSKYDMDKEDYCRLVNRFVDEGYTFNDYLSLYEPKLLEKSEYTIPPYSLELEKIENSGFIPEARDYLFIGSEIKINKNYYIIPKKQFVDTSPLVFFVRKIKEEWKVVAINDY